MGKSRVVDFVFLLLLVVGAINAIASPEIPRVVVFISGFVVGAVVIKLIYKK